MCQTKSPDINVIQFQSFSKKRLLSIIFFSSFSQIIYAMLLFCLFSFCQAAPFFNSNENQDSKQPLEIQSDYASFDQATGNVVHRGHVLATQGSRILKSERLIIHRNNDGKIDNIISEGVPASFEVISDPKKSKIIGHANILHYFPKENKIILKNAAELKQDDNTIQAATIVYDFNTGKLVTDSNEEERTTVIINSKSSL